MCLYKIAFVVGSVWSGKPAGVLGVLTRKFLQDWMDHYVARIQKHNA